MGFSSSRSPTRFSVLTLHLDVWFTLSNHFFFFFFFFLEKIIFILSLSDQVLGSHSPCAYLIYTLQADIGFNFLFFFSWGFHPLALQTGFTFSLSM